MSSIKRNRSPDGKTQKEKVKEITDQLETGVKAVFESDAYKAYLKCMSKFHNYSLNNTLLIALQRPDASLVCGYKTWEREHGRHVRKGEKGIKILAPYTYKVEVDDRTLADSSMVQGGGKELSAEASDNGKKTIECQGFKVVHVYDIDQTEGRELPSIGVSELIGDVNGYRKLFNALTEICPVPIYSEDIQGGAKGYYNDAERKIVVKSGMSQLQTIKTVIHEMSHEHLHAKVNIDPEYPLDRRTKEVEAESVAFCVSNAYGLDTSDYSMSYIAGWSSGKETKELKASLERIRTATDEMITAIDKALDRQTKREKARWDLGEAR